MSLTRFRRTQSKSRHGVTADAVLKELEIVRRKDDGKLLPESVVERARSARSPLHSFFEWDDTAAAAQHRLWQARNLIREVQIAHEEGGKPQAAYVSVQIDKESYYKPPSEVVDDQEEYASACTTLMNHIAGAQQTLAHLRDLAGKLGDDERGKRLSVAFEALLTARAAVQAIQ